MTEHTDWKDLRPGYAELIETFGKAWEQGKPDEMASVFTDDGVFSPNPLEPPVRGKAAIRVYWKDAPLEQAEVSFRFGEIFVAGPWFSTEIRCTFRRRRSGKMMDVRGALFCETIDGKIAEMRMYWHRTER